MRIPVTQLKQGLISKTGGKALSSITNFNAVVAETFIEIMQNVAMPSSVRKVPFISPLVEEPYLRLLPDDMAMEGLIDVYKRDYQKNHHIRRTGNYGTDFKHRYGMGLVEIVTREGRQYLNLKDDITSTLVLDSCEDKTNGDWQTLGTAYNLQYDTQYKIQGRSSVSYDVNIPTATPYGILKNNFVDIVSLLNKKYIVINHFFPVDIVTGVTVRFGKDAANYREVVITKDYTGARIKQGWNILLVDIASAVVTGIYNPTLTPSDDDVRYLYISPNDTLTALTQGFRVDSIFAVVDIDYDIEYYSNSVVVDKYGSRRAGCLIESDDDYILVNEAEYLLFLKQWSVTTGADVRPAGANTEIQVHGSSLAALYAKFMMQYPSQRVIRSSEY